jgi:NFU1 iron-sulfur cluster scaffold homolog, mitochondrial
MSIVQVKENPNINSCQFVVDHSFFGDDMWEASSLEEASKFPLAQTIWNTCADKITQVFFHDNIIVIQKKDDLQWNDEVKIIQDKIEEYFTNEKTVLNQNSTKEITFENQDEDINNLILEVIRDYVQPYIAEHGGFIKFHGFTDGIAYISMHGSCSGCPSSAATLNQVVENVLRLKVPGLDLVKLVE